MTFQVNGERLNNLKIENLIIWEKVRTLPIQYMHIIDGQLKTYV